MEPVDRPTDAPPIVSTPPARCWPQWRAAERRLDEIPEGSAEWRAMHREIDVFRSRYHEHVRTLSR